MFSSTGEGKSLRELVSTVGRNFMRGLRYDAVLNGRSREGIINGFVAGCRQERHTLFSSKWR